VTKLERSGSPPWRKQKALATKYTKITKYTKQEHKPLVCDALNKSSEWKTGNWKIVRSGRTFRPRITKSSELENRKIENSYTENSRNCMNFAHEIHENH
jgi:hypothetical protein